MKNTVFRVPEHYFDTLPDLVMARVAQASPLEAMERRQVFCVPDAYFEELPAYIQAKITRLEGNVFEVPEHYFDELPAHIQQKALPALPTVGKIEDVLSVPQDYFENLQHHITRKINQSKAPKTPLWAWKNTWKWATVGVVCGLAFLFPPPFLPTTPETTIVIAKYTKPKTALPTQERTTEKTPQIIALPAPIALPTIPTQTAKQEDTPLVNMLAKADKSTEEALLNLVESEDMAGSEEEEEAWHETHEEILHELSEEDQ
ncbi:MAG: hypothetical protein EAZ95_16255 [Bacteroidetes bacterium]|nr:MAG: hypothetical protein EAZ95_16255 [Bacteroidota bacterium]